MPSLRFPMVTRCLWPIEYFSWLVTTVYCKQDAERMWRGCGDVDRMEESHTDLCYCRSGLGRVCAVQKLSIHTHISFPSCNAAGETSYPLSTGEYLKCVQKIELHQSCIDRVIIREVHVVLHGPFLLTHHSPVILECKWDEVNWYQLSIRAVWIIIRGGDWESCGRRTPTFLVNQQGTVRGWSHWCERCSRMCANVIHIFIAFRPHCGVWWGQVEVCCVLLCRQKEEDMQMLEQIFQNSNCIKSTQQKTH